MAVWNIHSARETVLFIEKKQLLRMKKKKKGGSKQVLSLQVSDVNFFLSHLLTWHLVLLPSPDRIV